MNLENVSTEQVDLKKNQWNITPEYEKLIIEIKTSNDGITRRLGTVGEKEWRRGQGHYRGYKSEKLSNIKKRQNPKHVKQFHTRKITYLSLYLSVHPSTYHYLSIYAQNT